MKQTISILCAMALVISALLSACNNPFVQNILPDNEVNRPTPDTTMKIIIKMSGNVSGDSVTASSLQGEAGDKITLSYTLARTKEHNRLVFSGTKPAIAQVDSPGTAAAPEAGTREYTVNAQDAPEGVIIINAVFSHSDKELDTIAFADAGNITKTYGDAPFTKAIVNTGAGSGAITYSSGDPGVAAVNASTGEVTILKAGTTTITAAKEADATYERAIAVYTLTVTKAAGAAVSGKPVSASVTSNSITVSAVTVQTPNPGNQGVEYAIAAAASPAPETGWQTDLTFSGLTPATDYYVFARSKENDNYHAGAAQVSAAIRTSASGATVPVQTIVDFEADAIGKTYGVAEGDSAPTVKVVADPVNGTQKSLQISAGGYNQAAIIPINLEQKLSQYQTFTFRLSVASGSDLGYKKVLVYAASTAETFVQYGFGNPANSEYPQFAANFLGETEEKDFSAITKNTWTDFSITISNPGAAIRDLQGDIFIAIGIQSENMVYLLDDLTFTGTSSGGGDPPGGGGEPTGPTDDLVDFESAITPGFTKGNSSPTVAVVNDPGNPGQKSLQFTAGSGDAYNQAAVIPITLSKELYKFQTFSFRFRLIGGTDVADKRILVYAASDTAAFKDYSFGNPASDSNNFAANLVGQTAETSFTDSHKNTWTDFSFTIENPNTTIGNLKGPIYLAIGINCKNANYLIDDLAFTGTSGNPPPGGGGETTLVPSLVDFESDALNKTYEFTRGDNDPTVKVVADPANGAQKSLQITTGGNGWNQAAIIPINLPKALSAYKSFTFRFYLPNAVTDTVPRTLQVYAASSTSAFVRYGFGNAASDSNQFAANLVGSAPETLYNTSYTGRWIDYEIECTAGSAISGLQGDIYIAVGMNCNDNRTYLLDDLTFSESSNNATVSEPSPATFDRKTANQTDVTVTMTLNGNTLLSIKNSAATLTSGTDYSVSGSTVTIKKEYLATLAEGTASLTFVFSAGVNRTITISIVNTSNSSISPATATFDKKTANQTDVTVTMTLNGNTLTGIKNGAATLTSNTDYTESGSTVIIKKEYLAGFTKDTTQTLTFEFSAGASQTIAISIIESGDVGTEYVFSTTTIPSGYPKYSNASNISAQITGGVLRVTKSNSNHSTEKFILPFSVGSSPIAYTKIEIVLRGVSDDYTNKEFRVEAGSTVIASVSNSGLSETNKTLTLTLSNTASLSGDIELGFVINNSSNFVYEITSIKLIP